MAIYKNIAILLCTYNGENFLEKQLVSLSKLNAMRCNINIFVSDDGSSDKTMAILNKYSSAWSLGGFNIVQGPSKGFSRNFCSLISNSNIDADYFMLCDQDDIWLPNRVELFLSTLLNKSNIPALYCAKTCYIDSSGKSLGKSSKLITKPLSFRNALVENIASGNTFVFNRKAKQLFEKVEINDIVYHDWLCYLLISAVDGFIFYDETISVLYRQHGSNQLGGGGTLKSIAKRFSGILHGKYKSWNDINIRILLNNASLLASKNVSLLYEFSKARKAAYPYKIFLLYKIKIYSQTKMRNLAMWFSIFLNLF